ncbi:hypothetical protein [Winogradskyella sp. 3972H.M.0a.05]|uniref:hypothetical protein n=1 Tax=Winogradskyella sp. 3972H.M.0a.05 TaxID=2950277 RepID=UPI003392C8AD
MKPKKILKIILGVIIFLTLPSLLFFGFLYLKYNEPLPEGIMGSEADVLATRMLDALNHDAYEATDHIEFTFKNRHHYKWNKAENSCEVYWKHYKVDLDLNNYGDSKVFIGETEYEGEDKAKLIKKAWDYFNNDTFWLVAPYKVFDSGVERRLVKTEEGKDALLVTYTSGGSTPGDSYLWHFDDTGKPISYQMWTSILPIDGLEASWSDWIATESGAQLPTFHKLLVLGLEMGEVKGTIELKSFPDAKEELLDVLSKSNYALMERKELDSLDSPLRINNKLRLVSFKEQEPINLHYEKWKRNNDSIEIWRIDFKDSFGISYAQKKLDKLCISKTPERTMFQKSFRGYKMSSKSIFLFRHKFFSEASRERNRNVIDFIKKDFTCW